MVNRNKTSTDMTTFLSFATSRLGISVWRENSCSRMFKFTALCRTSATCIYIAR